MNNTEVLLDFDEPHMAECFSQWMAKCGHHLFADWIIAQKWLDEGRGKCIFCDEDFYKPICNSCYDKEYAQLKLSQETRKAAEWVKSWPDFGPRKSVANNAS